MAKDNIRGELPIHPVPRTVNDARRLTVAGLVARPLELAVDDLAALDQEAATGSFTCLEGWTVQDVRWRGVPLAAVLEQAEPSPSARWVEASAGAFSVSLSLDAARRSLLALRLGDGPLPVEHGGPVRLVVPGGDCYTSVKWLDRLELREQPGPNTGRAIALERLSDQAEKPERTE
ncbi:MAG TPA: molybdopterin-dependent oxidoreductase [Chloroflexota bacterium]|nr:molybdopterin-dependent oxidoreductase [Chloroflexota bacterium]